MSENFNKIILLNQEKLKIFPISYVSTGSNIYGLSNKQNQEFAGIHLLDTLTYLQHPDFKQKNDIIRTAFDNNLNFTSEDNKNKSTGITSFEAWKFLSLYLNGSIVTYDILYLSPIYSDETCSEIANLLREGITNKIGISAKTYVMNNWQKDRTDQRKIVMSFYRLLQAVTFLREESYIADVSQLWEKSIFDQFPYGKKVYQKFKNNNFRKMRLSEKEIMGTARELESLIDEVNKASIGTRLPDETPKAILNSIMELIIDKRMQLLKEL